MHPDKLKMDEGELELDKPEICNGDGAVWARNEKEKEDDALEVKLDKGD